MQHKAEINKDATIYHYQLVRKINLRNESLASYLFIGFLMGGFQGYFYHYNGVVSWTAGLICVSSIHWVMLRLTMVRVDQMEKGLWAWRLKLPWLVYLPVQYVEYQLFRRLHRHLMWPGLCVFAVCYPWISESMIISLIMWHFWLLAPRLFVIHSLRKARKDGLIRIEGRVI
ncbi:transposase [Paenibacillus tarimensis]